MIPFKGTNGMIKNTAVIIILFCISESFSLLHRNPENLRSFPISTAYHHQASTKGESENSDGYFSRRERLETSPYIRDVRADSRQSRIDSRDIRTDFQEIRTELGSGSRLSDNRLDSRRSQGIDRERREVYQNNARKTGDVQLNNRQQPIKSQLTDRFIEQRRQYTSDPQNFRSNSNVRVHRTSRAVLNERRDNTIREIREFQIQNQRQPMKSQLTDRFMEQQREYKSGPEHSRSNSDLKSRRTSRAILNDRRDNRERDFEQVSQRRSVFDRNLQSPGESLQMRRKATDMLYRNPSDRRQTLKERRSTIEIEPVRVTTRNYYRENLNRSTERRYLPAKKASRQGLQGLHDFGYDPEKDRRTVDVEDARENFRIIRSRSTEVRRYTDPSRREQRISRLRFQPSDQRKYNRRVRDQFPHEARRESSESLPNRRNNAQDLQKYSSRDYSGSLMGYRFNNALPKELRDNSRDNRERLMPQRNFELTIRDAREARDRQEHVSRRTFKIVRNRNNRVRLSSRNSQMTEDNNLFGRNRLNSERFERGNSNDLSERRNNVRLTEPFRVNDRYVRNQSKYSSRSTLDNTRENRQVTSRVGQNREAKTSCLGSNHRENHRFIEMDRKWTSQRTSDRTHQQKRDRNENVNDIREKRINSENTNNRNSYRETHDRRGSNPYENRQILKDLQAIHEKRNINDSLAPKNTRDSIMATKGVKFAPNILINIVQTILIVALIGQTLKKSKYKLPLANWHSGFGKAKIF